MRKNFKIKNYLNNHFIHIHRGFVDWGRYVLNFYFNIRILRNSYCNLHIDTTSFNFTKISAIFLISISHWKKKNWFVKNFSFKKKIKLKKYLDWFISGTWVKNLDDAVELICHLETRIFFRKEHQHSWVHRYFDFRKNVDTMIWKCSRVFKININEI